MAVFKMKIAGFVGEITSLFDSTRDYCKDYLTEDAADFAYAVTAGDLTFEQAFLDREAAEEGFKPRRFTDPFLERAAIQRAFGEFLFEKDVLLLHGSLIATDGEGYFFAAKSGTGKSTHTRFWQQLLGERAVIVNDDKPFFTVTSAGITAHGAPWSGKHGLHRNLSVPLKAICLLERGEENTICPAEEAELLPMLLNQGGKPLDESKEARYIALTKQLLQLTPLWHLRCRKEAAAAEVAFSAMSE